MIKRFFSRASILVLVLSLTGFCFAADGSLLKPPTGAKVAVVVFEDLECPSCAHAYPVVWAAANASKVPVVLRDYPLSKHPWSYKAAIFARFFDTKSQTLGNDFRGYIYRTQPAITLDNLQQFVQKFADDNHVQLPFAIDPQGQLKAKVDEDAALGNRCGLTQTPTIFVVGGSQAASSFMEVTDLDKLTETVQEMQKRYPAPAPSASSKTKTKKTKQSTAKK
jgi:protein-disulfide isomerase